MARDWKTFFRVFLVLYTVSLTYHVLGDMPAWGFLGFLLFASGFAVAILAHSRIGYGTLVLILIHMGIEWSVHAEHGWHYEWPENALTSVHGMFDLIFLWFITNLVAKKWTWPVYGTLVLGLALFSTFFYQPETVRMQYEHGETYRMILLECLVMGGIFGCTVYHLFIPFPMQGRT